MAKTRTPAQVRTRGTKLAAEQGAKLPAKQRRNLGYGSVTKLAGKPTREETSASDLEQIKTRREYERKLEAETGLKRRGRV